MQQKQAQLFKALSVHVEHMIVHVLLACPSKMNSLYLRNTTRPEATVVIFRNKAELRMQGVVYRVLLVFVNSSSLSVDSPFLLLIHSRSGLYNRAEGVPSVLVYHYAEAPFDFELRRLDGYQGCSLCRPIGTISYKKKRTNVTCTGEVMIFADFSVWSVTPVCRP